MSENIVMADGIFGTDSDNYGKRVPCVVIMDCSYSMKGGPIEALNTGLKQFETEVKSDEKARRAARIMLIRVGALEEGGPGVLIRTPFQDAADFIAPEEIASGATPLGEAILLALQKIEQEKAYLNQMSLSHHRPWLFVMTDGAPTDGEQVWKDVCAQTIKAISTKKVALFPMAVDGGKVEELQKLLGNSERQVAKLNSVNFSQFFEWLSDSMGGAADSGEANPPMAPVGWATA